MDNTIIVVNDEPYCIWDIDISSRNKEFIQGIDADYFQYLNETHQKSEDEKRASVALRAALHHGMETFFSLLGAFLQAPDAVYAWVAKCNNSDLRAILQRVNANDKSLFIRYGFKKLTWKAIADVVFNCYLSGAEKQQRTAELFSALWQRLSHEYLDINHINEYNSIKHGFRIKAGGFALAIGEEKECGVSPPPSEMQLIGKSDYGTTFFIIKPVCDVKGNRNLTSRRVSLNWKVEKVMLLLQLLSMSINNITSALKIVNGINPETCKFTRPTEDEAFNLPWKHTPGVTSCNFDFVIDEANVPKTGRKELLERLKKHQIQINNE
jgi:hypothetical protein